MDDAESLSHTRWECKYHVVIVEWKLPVKGKAATPGTKFYFVKFGGGGGNRNCVWSFRINKLQTTDKELTKPIDLRKLLGIA